MRGKNAFNIEAAIRIYYSHPNEIGNDQIKELFDITSGSTCAKIKNEIREFMITHDLQYHVWNKSNVSTKAAFEYANLDIKALEDNFMKIKELKSLAEN